MVVLLIVAVDEKYVFVNIKILISDVAKRIAHPA